MDCKKMLAILAVVFFALPAFAQGTEHIVGDYYGWTLNFDYNAWAKGKEFRVGDTLVFKYAVGKHNVYKVNGPDFQACNVPLQSEEMATGNDVIMLTSTGRKWYMCGKANGTHCQKGMKLVINVLPANEKAPAPHYSSPPTWKAPPPSGSPYTGPKQHIVGDEKGWPSSSTTLLGLRVDNSELEIRLVCYPLTNYLVVNIKWCNNLDVECIFVLAVFNYAIGAHNVFKVSGSAFERCSVPPENEAMATGNDVITLATPGKKWYICGKAEGMHCWSGMKLVIDVLPSPSMEHAPVAAPLNSPTWEAPALAPSYSEWEAPSVAPPTGPRKFFVGDDKGWTLSFNYTAWAEDKEFHVGDKLVFKYAEGKHNVFKVDGPAFQACHVPPESEALTTGYDVITLTSPGRKWYICGKAYGAHCQKGQKLVINVLPAAGQIPAQPSPPKYAPSPRHGYGRKLFK